MNIDYPATIIKLRAILDLSQAALAELQEFLLLRLIDGKMANMSQLDLLKKNQIDM